MPIAFLAPIFLAGLAALAVPVVIHLANRPKKERMPFPSLMFLEKVEYQASSRRRLRHVVLFTLRSLALILLAAAFARPFVDRPDAIAAGPQGGRELVVLVDRSASMAVGDRMERAREAARAFAEGLQRGDRATVIGFDRDAAAVNRATDDPAVFRAALAGLEPGAGATRFGPALRLAESILGGSPLPRRELVLVTDFQRTGWDEEAGVVMPPGTEVRTVAVGEPAANVAVANVELGRERFAGRDRVRVAATVSARPAGAREAAAGGTVPVQLVVNGRPLQTVRAALPAAGATTVAFDPFTVPDGSVRATVRAGTDAFPADNAFHFTLSAERSLRVVVASPRGGGPYLARALEAGARHDVARVAARGLAEAGLAGADVVVLDGADPGPDAAAGLEAFVRDGGGLVVVLGARSRDGSWPGALLPGTIGGTRDIPSGTALTGIRTDHPLFEPFRAARGAGLAPARFHRYRGLEVAADPDVEVLARFEDGAPAVVSRAVGKGRVVVLTSPFDGLWNDLVLRPAFVPFVHGLVRYASGREASRAWRTVGELLDVAALVVADPDPEADAGAEPVLLTPSDQAIPVGDAPLRLLEETGFYEVRDPRSGAPPVAVAVNGDPAESDLQTLDPETVRSAVASPERVERAASFAPEQRERTQSLWWYVLAAAFVMMVAETALSNRLSRRVLPGRG